MLTFIFFILFFAIFGSILKFALKATWGIFKFVVSLVLLPIILVALVLAGLVYVAIPVLVIVGIVFLVKALSKP